MNHRFVLSLLATLSLAATTRAADSRFYLTADAGVALTDDVNAVVPTFGPAVATRLDLRPGVRLSVAGGWRVTDWFALEAETGVMGNGFDGVTGNGAIAQLPLLANAVVRCHRLGKWEPFAGAGAGGAFSVLNLDKIQFTGGGPVFDGSATDTVFAWQAFGGLRYRFNQRMSLGVAYKYLHTGDADWKVKGFAPISAEGASSHSLSAVFSIRF